MARSSTGDRLKRRSSGTKLGAIVLGGACAGAVVNACAHKRPANFEDVVVTSSPPLAECQLLGVVKGHGSELEVPRAQREAEEELRDGAAALGGNYVVLTARDEKLVDMSVHVQDVRLKGRAYHCPVGPGGAPLVPTAAPSAVAWSVPADAPVKAGDAGASEAGAAFAGRCPAGTEARPTESAEEPGYQCGIRDGGRFIAEGPYARFWPGGAVKTEGTFARGKRSGTWKTFDTGGQLREERSYRDGELDGPSRTWDASGVLTSDKVYRAGIAVGPDGG